jgi:hypothetical protein
MEKARSWLITGFVALLLAASAGCHCAQQDYVLEVAWHGDPNSTPTAQVDIVAVNSLDEPRWKEMSVSDYFAPDSKQRASVEDEKLPLKFGDGNPADQTLDWKADPKIAAMWTKWYSEGATHLFILTDYPASAGASGGADARKQELPLGIDYWCKWPNCAQCQTPVQIEINTDGLKVLTPPPYTPN